jgi:hypothetical protein
MQQIDSLRRLCLVGTLNLASLQREGAMAASLVGQDDDDSSSGVAVSTSRSPIPSAAAGSIGIFSAHPRAFGSGAEPLRPDGSAVASAPSGSRDLELVDLKPRGGGSGSEHKHDDVADVHVQLAGDEDAADAARSHRARSSSDGGASSGAGPSERVGSPRPPRIWPSVLRDGWRPYISRSLRAVLLSTKSNWLLLAIPIAVIAKIAGWSPAVIFFFSLMALCPLAERISFVTVSRNARLLPAHTLHASPLAVHFAAEALTAACCNRARAGNSRMMLVLLTEA